LPTDLRNRRSGARRLHALAIAIAAVVVSLLAVAPASAARCEGAPGLSAVQQYCETVPSAGGDRSPLGDATGGGSGAGSGGPAGSFLSPQAVRPAVLRQLRRSGITGRELAARLAAGGSDRVARLRQPAVPDDATVSGGWVKAVSEWGQSLGALGALAAVGLVLTGVALVVTGARRRSTDGADADD
jgi:hypothetical protein